MFEQVKDYKSACAVLGKKPIDKRRKLDEHVVSYIMLSTITEAINFIANGNKPIKTWCNWWYIGWNKIKDGSSTGLFYLGSGDAIGYANAHVGTHLRFINREAAEYAAKTFQPLYMKHIFGID